MRTRASFSLLGAWLLLTACGNAAPQQEARTAGGCACTEAGDNSAAVISLDCYCAEFPNRCLGYEEAKASVVVAASDSPNYCGDAAELAVTEQQGCGKLVISFRGGLGGHSLVYDEKTRALIGAKVYGDVPYGACSQHEYVAGETDTCLDAPICFLCEPSANACEPACSLNLLTRYGRRHVYDPTPGALYECGAGDLSPRPELHLGCGVVRVVRSYGSETYTLGTHEPRRLDFVNDAECPNGWGEPTATCADEIVCSLCKDDPNVCTPEQLRAE